MRGGGRDEESNQLFTGSTRTKSPENPGRFTIAIGKKNWLFTGSERAGQRAAAVQTLFGTAQLNGLNPSDWLKETLTKLPTWPNSRIDELLPLPPEFIETLKQKN